jgi:hypothetical protein
MMMILLGNSSLKLKGNAGNFSLAGARCLFHPPKRTILAGRRMLKLVDHINYYRLDLISNIYCRLPVRIVTLKNNLISVRNVTF